jgi:hypothetical protein
MTIGSVTVMIVALTFRALAKATPCLTPLLATSDPSRAHENVGIHSVAPALAEPFGALILPAVWQAIYSLRDADPVRKLLALAIATLLA